MYYEQGFENPAGWQIESQTAPLRKDLLYRVYCPDCNPRIVKKVGE